ncbi:MAG: hypothetical protein HY726_08580 [Candidatus Rokubacteria bacterium]|nr:hypothetical protein [Candidatus Rokubacteria bacterium]
MVSGIVAAGASEKKARDWNEGLLNRIGGKAERLERDSTEQSGSVGGADQAGRGEASAVDGETYLSEGKLESSAVSGPDRAVL